MAHLELLQKVEREAGEQPNLHLRLANAYLQLNRLDDAEQAVIKELQINPEEVSAHYTLGLIYYKQTRYEAALNSFMDTVGLLFYNPSAHFYIGETLVALQEYEKAIEAFDTCLKLVPGMNMARQHIIQLYESTLAQPGKAMKYNTDFQDKILDTINVVSGLPRSGTSMLMQMLKAGGLEIFTDGARAADENNPKGYYEHEAVKALKRNKTFLKTANGKTLKVIAQLLPHLPMRFRYRIVFVERDLLEVIASQQKMLTREGKRVKTDTLPLNLVEQYKKTLAKVKKWAANQPHIEIHYVQHKDVLTAPFVQAMLINDFFEGTLAVEKMANVVDGNLYREKVNI